MNTLEICSRPNNSTFTTEELIYVVQEYISEVKGVDVNINLTKWLDKNHPFFKHLYVNQLNKLNTAFNKTQKYYLSK